MVKWSDHVAFFGNHVNLNIVDNLKIFVFTKNFGAYLLNRERSPRVMTKVFYVFREMFDYLFTGFNWKL
jgi:hypothetical protein